jgi:hypothetical protein
MLATNGSSSQDKTSSSDTALGCALCCPQHIPSSVAARTRATPIPTFTVVIPCDLYGANREQFQLV